MKRRTPSRNTVTLHLPKPTLDAIVEFAKAGDISASTIVAALLAGHVDELRQLTAIAMKARGSGFASLDEGVRPAGPPLDGDRAGVGCRHRRSVTVEDGGRRSADPVGGGLRGLQASEAYPRNEAA
jgi:hypothetical protein